MKMKKIKYVRTQGFTLIELLVVVIIIAILAAIAVPQYKHAALKSRFSTVMPMAKAVADAQEVYYQGRQLYALDVDELDVTPVTAENTSVTLGTADEEEQYAYVAAQRSDVPGVRYIMYQKYSLRFAGNIHCEAAANNEEAVWLCEKGLHGTEVDGSLQGSGYKTYLLSGDAAGSNFVKPCPEGATCNSDGDVLGCTPGHYQSGNECMAQATLNTNCEYSSSCKNLNYTGYKIHCYSNNGDPSACDGSTFSGSGSMCYPQSNGADKACYNTTYTGYGALCNGQSINACQNSTFYGGSYCQASYSGACANTTYLPNASGQLGCCKQGSGTCPLGVPKCKVTWPSSGVQVTLDGWYGDCCNPNLVGGIENCGSTPTCS